MSREREGYGFSNDAKDYVHKRANDDCERDNCVRPNNGVVHHLEGCFIAKLDRKPKPAISNPEQNALMLCEPHAWDLDRQQEYQVECLLYERQHTRSERRINRRDKRASQFRAFKRRR